MSPQANTQDPHNTAMGRKHYWGLTKGILSKVAGVVASRWQANGGSHFILGPELWSKYLVDDCVTRERVRLVSLIYHNTHTYILLS